MAKLELWQRADNYIGQEYSDYYEVLGRHRDSDILTNSNFEVATTLLGGEKEPEVIIVRSGHWAVGWIEFIGVHKDATDKVAIAQKILDDIKNYPVLDDEDYSRREYEEVLGNIKDSLHQVSDLDNIPDVEDLYSYFSDAGAGKDMTEEFYPDKEQLLIAIEYIARQKAEEKQIQAGQTTMEI